MTLPPEIVPPKGTQKVIDWITMEISESVNLI